MTRRTRAERIVNWLALLLFAAALLPIAVPFTQEGFPHGHDTAAHVANLFRFDRAFSQGQIPVRWVEGLTPGHGQPLFNYYQVGFFYFVQALHLTGMSLSTALKAAPVVLWWSGAVFVLLWLRPFGLLPAVAGSVAFALSPYAIIDVFVRAAYPEFTAIVSVAGALWCEDAYLRTKDRRFLPAFAVFVACMLVSHLPAALIAAPLFLAEAVAVGGGRKRLGTQLRMLVAFGALGLGVATFYVVPAMVELHLVQMWRLTADTTDYRRHFVPARLWTQFIGNYDWHYFGTSVSDPSSLMPLHIGLVEWTVLAVGLALMGSWAVRRRHRLDAARESPGSPLQRHVAVWIAVVMYAMAMMHEVSATVWDALPFLAFIQFPWRFFLLISFGGAALTAALVSRVRPRSIQVVCMVLVVGTQVHLYHRRLRPAGYIPHAELNIDDPRWTRALTAGARAFEEPGYDPAGTPTHRAYGARWSVADAAARVSAVRDTDAHLELRVTADRPTMLRLHIPFFPGWRTRLDGVDMVPERLPPGSMMVPLPSGAHRVTATFENTPLRSAAGGVTVMSLALVALAAGVAARNPGRRRHGDGEPAGPAWSHRELGDSVGGP